MMKYVVAVVVAGGVFGVLLMASCASFRETNRGDQPGLAATPGVDPERSFAQPKDPGTPYYHSLRGEAWRPILGEENWQRNVVDDPNRTAVADPAMFREFASAFQDFPLYWVGLEFHGLPLTGIRRDYAPHTTPPEDVLFFGYGTCMPPPSGGCREPLQITVEPYCYGPAAPQGTEDGVFQVRGADAQHVNIGSLWLWVGEVFVNISTFPEERLVDVAEALVAANGQGPATPDQPFPPLDSDCSDFPLEPHSG